MVIHERVKQDILKLSALSKSTKGRINILSVSGSPTNKIELELRYTTVASPSYPTDKATVSKLQIDLLGRYPFAKPQVKFITPIFNPNVFPSNLVCIGEWMPTEFLDLLVKRLVKLMVYDPLIINVKSPANSTASAWYKSMLSTNPNLFPTEDLSKLFSLIDDKPKLVWHNLL